MMEEERDENGLLKECIFGSHISLLVKRVQAAQTVCNIARVQCGSDYLANAFKYIDTELAVVRNELWDLEAKIKVER